MVQKLFFFPKEMLKDFGRLKKTHVAIQSNPIKEVYIIIRFVRLKNMSYIPSRTTKVCVPQRTETFFVFHLLSLVPPVC